MALIDIKVPDIGDFKDVAVIELLVKPGDTIKQEQSLITVESDKASMEIPSSHAGVVKELKIQLGDKVSEGSVLLSLESSDAGTAAPAPVPSAPASAPAAGPAPQAASTPTKSVSIAALEANGVAMPAIASNSAPPIITPRGPLRSASAPATGCATPHISWPMPNARLIAA